LAVVKKAGEVSIPNFLQLSTIQLLKIFQVYFSGKNYTGYCICANFAAQFLGKQ
jgi:hypothetical protein